MDSINKMTFLYFEQGRFWVAQCLEYDIAMQARSLEQLFFEVGRVLAGHVAVADELGRLPFQGLEPAPEKFHAMAKDVSSQSW